MNPRRTRAAFWIALLAGTVATLAEFGQLWAVNAARPQMLVNAPPAWVIVAAALAGALAIPLYGLGYAASAWNAVAAPPRRIAVTAGGAIIGALGSTVHTSTGLLIAEKVGGIASGLDPMAGILTSWPPGRSCLRCGPSRRRCSP
jgi:hypothetical protein